ncbi:hypothetical protein VPH35_074215 [Triticum aestivum]
MLVHRALLFHSFTGRNGIVCLAWIGSPIPDGLDLGDRSGMKIKANYNSMSYKNICHVVNMTAMFLNRKNFVVSDWHQSRGWSGDSGCIGTDGSNNKKFLIHASNKKGHLVTNTSSFSSLALCYHRLR